MTLRLDEVRAGSFEELRRELSQWKARLERAVSDLEVVQAPALFYASTAAVAVGAIDVGLASSTAPGYLLPAEYELVVLGVWGHFTTGATAGSHQVSPILKSSLLDSPEYTLATVPGVPANTVRAFSLIQTVEDPIATIPASSLLRVGLRNESTSVGALAASTVHHVSCSGYLKRVAL